MNVEGTQDPPVMIAARAAHVMLGNRVKGKAMAIGNSADDGSLLVMDLGPNNEMLGPTDTTPWSLVLCQWDDSRAIFALDSDGHIYDENTPSDGEWSSWTRANDKIFSTATIPQASKMKDLVYANFQNLQTTMGLKEAMFYLTAVAYDIDTYETSNGQIPQASKMKDLVYANFQNLQTTMGLKEAMFYLTAVAYDIDTYETSNGQIKTTKVLESMMENYRLIDDENLDAIEAATIKAYGRPKFYDLDFSRLAGRWTDWEGDLTKLSLPSTMWLILRRATGLLGRVDRPKFYDLDFSRLAGRWTDWEGDLTKLSLPSTMWLILRRATGLLGRVDRSIVIPVIKLFIPDTTDLTQTIMTRIPASLVQSWLKVLRSWVKPDTPGLWADASRLEWVIEYIKLTNLLVYDPNPWTHVTPSDDWSVEVKAQFDKLSGMTPEDQLDMLINTWQSVLDEVFYPSVQESNKADSDILDEAVVDTLHNNLELESSVLAFASLLTDSNPPDEDIDTDPTSNHKNESNTDKDGGATSSNGSVPQPVDGETATHGLEDDATITKSSIKEPGKDSPSKIGGNGKPKSTKNASGDEEKEITKDHKLNKLSNHMRKNMSDDGSQSTGTVDGDAGEAPRSESSDDPNVASHSRLRRVDEVPESEDGEVKSSGSKTLRKSIIPESTEDDDDPDMIDWSEVMISDDEDYGEVKSSGSKTLRKSIIPESTEDDDDPDMIDWSEVMISDDEDL